MQDDSAKKIKQPPAAQRSVVAVLIEHTRRRFHSSPAQVLLLAALALFLVVLVAYLLWPRQGKVKIAVETPPTLEAKHEGEEHDEHSQEGSVEVSDETAELVGLKTEK